jgi:hypothetical protein
VIPHISFPVRAANSRRGRQRTTLALQLNVNYIVTRMKEYPFLTRLSSFMGRAVVFFFFLSVLLFFFYILGNYQDFLDSTQLSLLSFLRFALSLELACSAYFGILLVRQSVHERRAFIFRWVLLAFSTTGSVGLLLVLQYVRAWLHS